VLLENADGDAVRPPGTCPIPAPAFRIDIGQASPSLLNLVHGVGGSFGRNPPSPAFSEGNEREERQGWDGREEERKEKRKINVEVEVGETREAGAEKSARCERRLCRK
jgi:hypothetical protein